MVSMSPELQADVGLLHVAGGAGRTTPPPGVLARAAPRRAARGRADDLLFLTVALQAAGRVPPGLVDHLAQSGADIFYRTPGSVTSALREVVLEINDELFAAARGEGLSQGYRGRVAAGVLRGKDYYLAQCGAARLTLIRAGKIGQLSSPEAAERPLGSAPTPTLRYHHLELQPADTLLITPFDETAWTEGTLGPLSALDPTQACERLNASAARDLTGLLIRVMPPGQVAAPLPSAEPSPSSSPARTTPPRLLRRRAGRPAPTGGDLLASVRPALATAAATARSGLSAVGNGLATLITRLAPGLGEAPKPGTFPPALLAATAVAIPLIVLAVVSVVYFKQGRTQEYSSLLIQAQAAIQVANENQDPVGARQSWVQAQSLLDQAAGYGSSQQLDALQTQVSSAIDNLDQVKRLAFSPVVSGGFGGDARISALAATASDLYVLDASRQTIWRAWSTGRGFEIDRNFDCLKGASSFPGMGTPVDLAVQPAPGALGAEGVVAIDPDGTLLYCAPDRRPLTGQLTPPDTGFGRIQAMDVFNNTLFVLDPKSNAVWMYDATGGVFTGSPSLYFAEQAPDLHDAIDIADAQQDLFILHADGKIDSCQRTTENQSGGGVHIKVTCDFGAQFKDDRPGAQSAQTIPNTFITEMDYSAPPEPSLYFMDTQGASVYQYSMRMVYQNRLESRTAFGGKLTAMTLGPPNDLYLAAGDQVYYAPLH